MEEARKVRVLVIGESQVVNKLINKFTCVGEERATTIATIGTEEYYSLSRDYITVFHYEVLYLPFSFTILRLNQITRYGRPV